MGHFLHTHLQNVPFLSVPSNGINRVWNVAGKSYSGLPKYGGGMEIWQVARRSDVGEIYCTCRNGWEIGHVARRSDVRNILHVVGIYGT